MRTLLLCTALLFAPALAVPVAAAPCEAGTSVSCEDVEVGNCTYDAHANVITTTAFHVSSDCSSGITRCYTEVSGGQSDPVNVERWCVY
jgi:hypothetical protein